MGCLSSKLIMSRSLSLREEFNNRIQRSANSIHYLQESAMSENINHDKSFKPSFDEVELLEHITKWELQEHDKHTNPESLNLIKRSSSFSSFAENELFPTINSDMDGEGRTWDFKVRPRSRSFHTVEEFDDMIKQIRLKNQKDDEQMENRESTLRDSITETSLHPKKIGTAEMEKGFKRKSIGRRLESLEIPHAIQLPSVASLREWLQSGVQVYSPGVTSYVTPKFGTNSSSSSETTRNDGDAIFNPELVASMEEHMQQLEAEAESILNQIAETDSNTLQQQQQTRACTEILES